MLILLSWRYITSNSFTLVAFSNTPRTNDSGNFHWGGKPAGKQSFRTKLQFNHGNSFGISCNVSVICCRWEGLLAANPATCFSCWIFKWSNWWNDGGFLCGWPRDNGQFPILQGTGVLLLLTVLFPFCPTSLIILAFKKGSEAAVMLHFSFLFCHNFPVQFEIACCD